MQNYSVTQAGNYLALAGVIVYIASLFGVNVTSEEIEKGIVAVVCLVGVVTSIIGRYRQGDISISGFKK